MELTYEDVLRGEAGNRLVLADAAGRELLRLGEVEPRPGTDLVLSIDLELQRSAAAAVARGIEAGVEFALTRSVRHGDPLERSGAAVVMDVRSGELLALVSIPSYEANAFSGREAGAGVVELLGDETRPLVHRAYQEVQSPGSIFKPLVGAAAPEEGVATPSTRITSTGAITVRSVFDPSVTYTFRDWAAHGTLDFAGGLVRSSDVYYYYLSGGYGGGRAATVRGAGRRAHRALRAGVRASARRPGSICPARRAGWCRTSRGRRRRSASRGCSAIRTRSASGRATSR